MKTSRTSPKHLMARLGIVATVVAAASCSACSAGNRTHEPKLTHLGPLPRITTEPVSNGECTGRAAARPLLLKGADDRAFKLAHIPGCGWRLLTATTNEAAEGSLAARSVAAASAEGSAAQAVDPMAVFIDGPTGYTFTWSLDGGWRFVGHLVDEDR